MTEDFDALHSSLPDTKHNSKEIQVITNRRWNKILYFKNTFDQLLYQTHVQLVTQLANNLRFNKGTTNKITPT
jgi:hypothetical protein